MDKHRKEDDDGENLDRIKTRMRMMKMKKRKKENKNCDDNVNQDQEDDEEDNDKQENDDQKNEDDDEHDEERKARSRRRRWACLPVGVLCRPPSKIWRIRAKQGSATGVQTKLKMTSNDQKFEPARGPDVARLIHSILGSHDPTKHRQACAPKLRTNYCRFFP